MPTDKRTISRLQVQAAYLSLDDTPCKRIVSKSSARNKSLSPSHIAEYAGMPRHLRNKAMRAAKLAYMDVERSTIDEDTGKVTRYVSDTMTTLRDRSQTFTRDQNPNGYWSDKTRHRSSKYDNTKTRVCRASGWTKR